MKKILIASNMVLLVIVFFQACNWQKDHSNTGPVKPQTGFCADSNCYVNDGSALTGMLSASLALQMSEDYGNDAGKKFIWNNEKNSDSSDARNIWFDLKKIKAFIGYVESSLCQNGCIKTDSFGLRFYYAKYPDKKGLDSIPELREVPKEYANHHTLFIVPTYRDAQTGKDIDFDPQVINKNCMLEPINISDAKTRVYGLFAAGAGGTGQQQNHGGLKPPPAGGNFPTVE